MFQLFLHRVFCRPQIALTLATLLIGAALPHHAAAQTSSQNCLQSQSPAVTAAAPPQFIVIGFMGGYVPAGNLHHTEDQVAQRLQQLYPGRVHAAVYANHDWPAALKTTLHQLDTNNDGCLSHQEKSAARIILYGHSWGASEAVTLARRLNALNIPVLLTIQVDSVHKGSEDDAVIPPNVRQAVNFFESEGILHGRAIITAADPSKTTILGNFQYSYRDHPVSTAGYAWYARTFTRRHVEIENDPAVWNRVQALIAGQIQPTSHQQIAVTAPPT